MGLTSAAGSKAQAQVTVNRIMVIFTRYTVLVINGHFRRSRLPWAAHRLNWNIGHEGLGIEGRLAQVCTLPGQRCQKRRWEKMGTEIPRDKRKFSEKNAREAARTFNAAGESSGRRGLHLPTIAMGMSFNLMAMARG